MAIAYRIQAFELKPMLFLLKKQNMIMQSSPTPCHIVFLEMHLMGVERYMYRFAPRDTFINAAMTEDM